LKSTPLGSNNIPGDKPADLAKGGHEITLAIEKKIPHVKILLCSVLPRDTANQQVHDTNALLAHEDNKKTVFYLDLTAPYEETPGHINTTLYVADHVHLTKEGYQIWYNLMEPLLAKLLA